MLNGKYTLRYIPKFENDLNEIVDYITYKLKNQHSAMTLIDKVENAISERLNCPLSFEPFQSIRKRKYPYYRIYVENFIIFYVVINEIMEIRRILYKSSN